MPIPRVLADLLSLPTAAFLEDAVLDAIQRMCEPLENVTLRADRSGNLLAHYRYNARKIRPVALVAHTDHPGFAAIEMRDRKTLRAAFRGGVKPEYFAGTKVRFWSDGRWIKGTIRKLSKTSPMKVPGWTARPEEALIDIRRPVEPGAPGMWDLPEAALRGDNVRACGCDDIAGVAAMIELLRRLSRKHIEGEVYCLFTRAEEVGFVGAVAACRHRTIPKRAAVISVETSSERAGAVIGDGPILRVGDKACIFSPDVTAFCERVAKGLESRKRTFAYQRKLMDGGTCEAFPFIAYGYAAGGICLSLGNYHNMDVRRTKIASEFIGLKDWQRMVDWFEALVADEQGPGARDTAGRDRVDAIFEKHKDLL